jgi:hypothetical protein
MRFMFVIVFLVLAVSLTAEETLFTREGPDPSCATLFMTGAMIR